MSQPNSSDKNSLNVQSIVLDKLLDDPQMKEVVVMEYERLTPWQMLKKFRLKAKQQGYLLIPNWLALPICNLLLVFLFGLLAAAIMLAEDPPGMSETVTAEPLKANQSYYSACFTWDDSCDLSKKLWCVDNRCPCYDQLTYWNGTGCIAYFNGSYYNGINCICPSYSYLYISSTNTCRLF